MKKIIDVSEHNGILDLAEISKSVDGLIARCSWGWGKDQIDKQWESNAVQASRLELPFYAYHYAYARTKSEAEQEAYLALTACQGHPVNVLYYDIEYSDFQGDLTCSQYYVIAKTFCDIIEKNGYSVGIYANENYFRTKLTNNGFSKWTLWLANYGNNNGTDNWNGELNYNPFGHVLLHQCTSNARNGLLKDIKGIQSEFLDCSIDHGLLSTFNKYQNNESITPSSIVKVKKGALWYDGENIPEFVFNNFYQVMELVGERAVIGLNGIITGAIHIKFLYVVNNE